MSTEISPLDIHELSSLELAFGKMIARRIGKENERPFELAAGCTLMSYRLGHACLDLNALPVGTTSIEESEIKLPTSMDQWIAYLRQFNDAIGPDKPLILVETPDSTLLYLNKSRQYEKKIADFIKVGEYHKPMAIEPEKVHAASGFFVKPFAEDAQQQAVHAAVNAKFSIVTGGPGTGKTTVLAVILTLELERNPNLKITLCAPTGKAANRMKEAIANAVNDTKDNQIKTSDGIKKKLLGHAPSTVHSLLKLNAETGNPRYNQTNQLKLDLLVIDECSMVSLELLAQLLDALPKDARVILLGDQNQLASIEAGAVLADLCKLKTENLPVTVLLENHRSNKNEPLCDFVTKIITDPEALDIESLYKPDAPDEFKAIAINDTNRKTAVATLKTLLGELLEKLGLSKWKDVETVEDVFALAESFKILCATRDGVFGVEHMNKLMCELLKMKDDDKTDGVPVIVTKNDYAIGLRNGDIGIVFDGKIHFPDEEKGKYRSFTPSSLPPHECAFAMTIHKSQGSDYDNVLMVLPNQDNPVLTRELIYTGITRTKKTCVIFGKQDILELAIRRKTMRWSGFDTVVD